MNKEQSDFLKQLVADPSILEDIALDNPQLVEDFKNALFKTLAIDVNYKSVKEPLECSTKGDKRYSAYYAKVDVFGVVNSIENHYQLSKRVGNYIPTDVMAVKGVTPTHFVINKYGQELVFDVKYLSSWYKLLWYKYLDSNPELVKYAQDFDEFTDMFKGHSVNCQADIIKQYVKKGRASVYKDCIEFINLLKKGAL